MNFVEELKWRGMIHDVMPGTEEKLNKEMVAGYVGFDPTASSLTIGNLVSIMLLVHLQKCGHKPIALIGGATGMIGDPSGKSEERKLLSEETLRHNQECQKKQLTKFLDFKSGKNAAELVNNYDWFKEMGFISFMRDVGKHLTVNYMMSKDSVKSRLVTGISFTEFSYQLLQGYDYYHLYKEKGCRLQMGGSDQWGNITAGTELIRRMNGGEAFALTSPLITKADGSKFGKSESGNVWLDPQMTSPFKFYQFWVRSTDEDAAKWIKIFTLLSQAEIEAILKEHELNKEAKKLQKILAKEVTILVHSEEEYSKALKATETLFGKSGLDDILALGEEVLLDAIDPVEISRNDFDSCHNVTDLLSVATQSKIFASKGEARKMITGGGVSINKNKVTDPAQAISSNLLWNKYLMIQKGKKNYYLVKVV
jgi:tyrosyl-tRNA synthetase